MKKEWGWLKSGIVLGAVFLLAVIAVKPIGVSTQYVIADAALLKIANKDLVQKTERDGKLVYSSSNSYLDKSAGKYAKAADSPFSTYGFVFVLAIVIGGFVSSRFGGTKVEQNEKNVPSYWQQRMGSSKNKRRLYTFAGGVLILFGARLAGGCTSGHMMSGIMQTSISGYIFAGAVFAIAVPVSLLMYKKSGSKQS